MKINNPADLQKALDLASRERVLFNSLSAQADAATMAARAPYDSKIKAAQAAEKALLAEAKVYCEAARASLLPRGSKSAEIGPHVIEWRDNGGAVVFAKKRSADSILAALIKRPRLAKLFVRLTPSIDKEAIAAKWRTWGHVLRGLGIRYQSKEIFAVTLGEVTDGEAARVKPESPEVAAP